MKKIYKLSKLPLWCVVLFGCGEVGGSESDDSAKMRKRIKIAEEKIYGVEDDVLALKRGQDKIPLQIEQQAKEIAILHEKLEKAKTELTDAQGKTKDEILAKLQQEAKAREAALAQEINDRTEALRKANEDLAALQQTQSELAKAQSDDKVEILAKLQQEVKAREAALAQED